MEIKVFTPQQFGMLEPFWKKLDSGCDMTAFQKYEWCWLINNSYFKEKVKNKFREWIYVLALDDEMPLMIAPIQVVKRSTSITCKGKSVGLKKGFYFIGREGYSDYMNFIYDAFSPQAVEEIFSFLISTFNYSYFQFEQMVETTSLWKYLFSNKNICKQIPLSCAHLPLPQSFDDYTKLLSKHMRQNIRTAINRQKRNGVLLSHEIVDDVSNDVRDTLMKIRAERLPQKRRKSKHKCSIWGKLYHSVFGNLNRLLTYDIPVMYEAKNQWFFLVKDGERVVSYYWGIRNDSMKEYYVILAGVDKAYEWYSPSISHLYLYLKECYENNIRDIEVLDFTRGGEKYKKDIGCIDRLTSGLVFQI